MDRVDDTRTPTFETSNGIKKKEDDSEVLKIYTGHELELKQKITLSDVISYQNAKSKGLQNDDQQLPDPQSSTPANAKKEPKMANNFHALGIKIGSWMWTSSREGDLMAKLYYQKSRLIWEFLKDGLKKKMEIEWSHITAIRAKFGDPSSLEIELNQPPLFFEESTPQPRKHTNWVKCKDFTKGQAASKFRRHQVIFPSGALNKPLEKLMILDKRLYKLSQMPFPNDTDTSPYFDGIEPASKSGNLTDQHYSNTAQGSPTPTNSSEPAASSLQNEEVQNLETTTPFCVNGWNFSIQDPSYNKAIQGYNNITRDIIYDNISMDSQNGERPHDMITWDYNQSNGRLSNNHFNYGSMTNVNNSYSINNAVMNYGYGDANLAMMQNVGYNFGHVDSVPPLNSPEVNESSSMNPHDDIRYSGDLV